jgi:hypothetical protein
MNPIITPSNISATVTDSFYMRELPKEVLVGYETPEGKALFRQALDEGGLEAFFPLSQQFLTQNEPACQCTRIHSCLQWVTESNSLRYRDTVYDIERTANRPRRNVA